MTGGYMGKVLSVDLSKGKTWDEPLDVDLCRDFVGGYGLGAKVIFDRQEPGTYPLGPGNILGFVTGPLTGTPALIGSRYTVVGKSPLTGTWGDANSGGDFGPHLKFAGYDAVFFYGASEYPVYLYIRDGKAELREAGNLWGKDTHETEDLLKAELGKAVRVACIGPAGEQLALISGIVTNKGRTAGRSGLGAVMGSKRLKAVAVSGGQVVPVSDHAGLREARSRYLKQIQGSMAYAAFRDTGTSCTMEHLNMVGEVPTKNWGGIPHVDLPDVTPLAGPAVKELTEKRYGCWRCPIGCGGLMKAAAGRYGYAAGIHRPEYETLASFGNMCLNVNLESIIMANDICNRSGLDTISTGTAIAFAIECYQHGIITDKDTEGVKLEWGNHEAIVEMTWKLAKREGLGNILADGVKLAAERIGGGSEEFAIHIHGQEPGLHDPKSAMSFATAFVDATPGRHTQGNEGMIPSGMPLPRYDRRACSGRGEAHKVASNMHHVVQSAGLCFIGSICMDADHLPRFLNLVTGSDRGLDDVLNIGERIANIRQAFNIREGISARDYEFPKRVLGRPPLSVGPTAGREVDIDTLRREFFLAMDWDPDTGKPSKAKLLELGLEDVAEVLWP